MAEKILTIKQGDADTFKDVVSNLSSLTGYSAKMYIYNSADTLVLTLTGTIDTLTITYELINEASKALTVTTHYYESKIFDSSDHVYTTSWGPLVVTKARNSDPS